MQNVSDEYKEALYDKNVVQSSITGTITTTAGTTYNLEDADILTGSLSINNKCVNNSSFEFGATYQGELSVTLINDNIDRYKLISAAVTFTEHRLLSDGTYEDISTGTFYVSEATRSKKTLTISALDAMDWLEIDVEEDTYGSVYQLLSLCATKSGLTLAQTEDEVLALCNAGQEYTYWLYMDTVDTYRTLVSYLAIMTGTFAIINIDNELELRSYATEVTTTIPASKRDSTTVSDYETYYSAITGRFIADENYATYSYAEEGDGLTLDIGDIPIVRGTTSFKHEVIQNLYEKLKEINYVPISFTLLTSDISLELGDMLTVEGEDVNTLITSITWNYHGSESIEGVGDNPRLQATDKTSRQLASISDSIDSKTLTVHTYSNAADISVSDDEVEVVYLKGTITEDATGVFIVTIPYEMNLDGAVTFYYYVDDALDVESTVSQYSERGKNIVTLSNYFSLTENTTFKIQIYMSTSYFDSDLRELTAKVYNMDVDTTIPTATIETLAVKAMLITQGKTGTTEKWDGTITASDVYSGVTYTSPYEVPANLVATVATSVIDTDTSEFSEAVATVSYTSSYSVTTTGINEAITFERGYTGLWGAWITEAWQAASGWTWKDMGDSSSYIVDVLGNEESEEE